MRDVSASVDEAHTSRNIRLVSGCHISLARGGSPDEKSAAIASAQRGYVSREQLLAADINRHAIDRRVRNGRLIRRHPGIYAVGREADGELAEETAALLALGSGAFLSHHSAATLWEVRIGTARPIHITHSAGEHRTQPHGVIVHRSRILLPRDLRVHRGLPVVSPARMMLDIAATLPERDLAYVLEECFVKRLLSEAELSDILLRAGRHPGAAALAHVAHNRTGSLTESAAQRRLLELIELADLPRPETERPVLDYRVDLLWPDLRLIVEVDGYSSHGTRGAFERDRRRDARLNAAGFMVLRFTALQIEQQPLATIARLAQAILAQSRARPRP